MDLDGRGGPVRLAATFDHVGIKRALGQEAGARDRARFVAKDFDEDVTDPPPLFLRVDHSLQGFEKSVGRVDHAELGTRARAERQGDRRPLTEPQQPGIDEHADHPRPESFRQQRRADGRVDPSR